MKADIFKFSVRLNFVPYAFFRIVRFFIHSVWLNFKASHFSELNRLNQNNNKQNSTGTFFPVIDYSKLFRSYGLIPSFSLF